MKFYKIFTIFALAAAGLCSCSDDEVKSPLPSTTGSCENISYTTATFIWNKVNGALQYGYELSDGGEEALQSGVTQLTSVKFSNLQPGTDYTLKVWSFADVNSSQTTSDPLVLTAHTLDAGTLGKPALEVYDEGAYYNVYWDEDTDASYYTYSLELGDEVVESGTTTYGSLWFSYLERGTYTVTVQAISDVEGLLDSEPATLSIDVNPKELWSIEGTYKSAILGTSWKATLVAYSDMSYTIKNWYVASGYDFSFYLDPYYPDNEFVIASADYTYDSSSYCYKIPTGRSDLSSVWVYPWYNYSSLTGDKEGGMISLCVYSSSAKDYVYDMFTWGEKGPADDYVGTWSMTVSGWFWDYDANDWSEFGWTRDVEVTKVNANTIRFPAFYFYDSTCDGVIDADKNTITIQPCDVVSPEGYSYLMSSSSGENDPVVGTIKSDGSLSFKEYTGWYGGYDDLASTKATMKKK